MRNTFYPFRKIQTLLLCLLITNIYFRTTAQTPCGTDEVLKNNPEIQKFLKQLNQDYQQKKAANLITPDNTTIYTIPVVVHVYHLGEAVGVGSNLPDSEIQDAIAGMNQAFRSQGGYAGISPDVKMQFVLASRSPTCQTTNGIVRVDGRSIAGYQANGLAFNDNTMISALRNLSSWPSSHYVNIRILHNITGAGGFAYFLNDLFMPRNATNSFQSAFWAHEMGHSMNLYHTFEGDGGNISCPANTNPNTQGDLVADTDPHKRDDGCNHTAINTCTGNQFGNILKNFMSYSCAQMFTNNQIERMRYALINYRTSLINSLGKIPPSGSVPVSACTVTATNGLSGYWGISNFTMGAITYNGSNSSSLGTNYQDLTCLSQSDFQVGNSYSFSLSSTYGNYMYGKIFIDYNNDGDFNDAGETVFDSNGYQPTHTGNITPPSGAVANTYLRMRVSMDEMPMTACSLPGSSQYGSGLAVDFSAKFLPACVPPSPPTVTAATRCDVGSLILSASGCAGTYNWYATNTGGSSIGSTASFTTPSLNNTTTYFVSCTIGCESTRSFVAANITQIPSATFTQSEVCTGTTTTLTAFPAGASSYQWKKNGVIIAGQTSQTYIASSTGGYSVVATQGNCGASESNLSTITFSNRMGVNFTNTASTLCSGTSTLTASSNIPAGATLQWVKDGVDTGVSTATYSVTQTGYYALKATLGTCSGVSFNSKTTIGQISASVFSSGQYSSLCGTGSLTLVAGSNGGTTSTNTYQWAKDGVDLSGETNSTYVANLAGNYTVKVTNGTCSAISQNFVLSNKINPPFISFANGITRACNASILLTTQSFSPNVTSFQWYKDEIAISGATNANHAATTSGFYTVVATQGTCSATSSPQYITIGSLNIPFASYNCTTGLLSTGNVPNGATVQWYRDSSPIAGATATIFEPTQSGQYQVAVTQGTCSEISSTSIINTANCTIVSNAIAFANGSTTICIGDGVLINASPSGNLYSFQWKKDGIDIPGANFDHFVAKANGNFTVLISNASGSAVSATPIAVTVGSILTPTITGNTVVCTGSTSLLSANVTNNILPTSYQWSLDGSPLAGATASSYPATQIGNYQVTITKGTCTAQSVNFSLSNGNPSVSIIPTSGIVCSGGVNLSTTFSGGNIFYQWQKNNVDIPNANGQSYRALTTDAYALRISQGNCTAVSNIVTPSAGTLGASISNPSSTICIGYSNRLTSGSNQSFYTYQWAKDNIDIAGATNQSFLASQTGIYKLTIGSLGCVGTATTTVTVTNTLPASSIGNSINNICNGSSVTFNAPNNLVNFQWMKNGVAVSGANSSLYTATTSGIYELQATQSSCRFVSNSSTVNTNGLTPTLNSFISTTNAGCSSIHTVFANGNSFNGNGLTYQWSKNGADVAGASNSSYTPPIPQDGLYTMRLSQGSCSVTTQSLKINSGIGQIINLASGFQNCGTGSKNMVANFQSGYTYQWVKDNVNIPNATSSGYTTSTAGNYQVITTFNGCSQTSETYTISMAACPCQSSYYSSSSIFGGPYTRSVSNDIISNEILNNFVTNTYDAKKSIVLLPGFATKNNVVFTAKIGGCN